MDEALIEKVARALYESEESLDEPVTEIPVAVLGTYQRRARAAIQAMMDSGWRPNVMLMSPQEHEKFLKMLDNPPESNEALRKLMNTGKIA